MIIKVFNESRFPFARKHEGDSGYDLHANYAEGLTRQIAPMGRILVRTGIYLGMPLGIEAQVRPRSGLARDHGVMAAVGTVDSPYRGEICVTLFNFGRDSYTVLPGDRVAQLAFMPVILPGPFGVVPKEFIESPFIPVDPGRFNVMAMQAVALVPVDSVEELGDTDRGRSGFGSTGR